MLARTVESKIIKYNNYLYPFEETHQITTTGDIVFGNLETPLIDGTVVPAGGMVFRANPKSVEGLTFGGFNMLSLANNHIKNKGTDGITNTINVLDNAEINFAGAGINLEEAQKPKIIEINGIKFGFLAYLDDAFVPDSYLATNDNSGSPNMDINKLIEDLDELKEISDVMIVSMHSGIEYTLNPTQKQYDFARASIDNGAKLVIGHHPHVVQPIEKYKDGYILYSLGNFIFDQMWSEETREGAIAIINFEQTSISNIELIPIKIYDYSQPRVLNSEEGADILKRMTDFTF